MLAAPPPAPARQASESGSVSADTYEDDLEVESDELADAEIVDDDEDFAAVFVSGTKVWHES